MVSGDAASDLEGCNPAIQLPFLAVGRVDGCVPLVSIRQHNGVMPNAGQDPEDIFLRILAAARVKLHSGQRTRLQWNEGSVCCLMQAEGLLLYAVVTTSMEYPEKHAFKLLQEVEEMTKVIPDLRTMQENGLADVLGSRLESLLARCEDQAAMDDFTCASVSMSIRDGPGSDSDESLGRISRQRPRGACCKRKFACSLCLATILFGSIFWVFRRWVFSQPEPLDDPKVDDLVRSVDVAPALPPGGTEAEEGGDGNKFSPFPRDLDEAGHGEDASSTPIRKTDSKVAEGDKDDVPEPSGAGQKKVVPKKSKVLAAASLPEEEGEEERDQDEMDQGKADAMEE